MTHAPIAVTMGEPAGISGEISIRAWQALARDESGPSFFIIADPDWIAGYLPDVPIIEIATPEQGIAEFAKGLPVLPLHLAHPVTPGTPVAENAPAVLESIRRAVAFARQGTVGAVVTNPIQKAVLYDAGFTHPGHTEFLAGLTDAREPPVMLLTCPGPEAEPGLRVALVTVHLALAEVARHLSADAIQSVCRKVASGLTKDYGIEAPRLAVAALNPHAGEAGALGREEIEIIAPAIRAAKAAGIDVSGPLPADTLFHREARARFDCVICMYHDQALIPLKTIDFAHGVNVTLGLDIVRTSPDHGCALDIAGQGIADPSSLIAALKTARDIAVCRASQHNG